MEAVAADAVLLAPLCRHRVGVGHRRHGLVERRVEHRHLGYVGEQPAADVDALQVGGVVQRSQRHQRGHGSDQGVVDQHRLGEPGSAVDHAVTDRLDAGACQRRPVLVERVERGPERLLEVRERPLDRVAPVGGGVHQPATALTDPLHRSRRRRRTGVPIDEAVLERRGAGVDDEDVGAHDRPCAWIAVMAMVLTMSRTVAPRDRSLTGLRSPWRIGPTARAPAERCTAL